MFNFREAYVHDGHTHQKQSAWSEPNQLRTDNHAHQADLPPEPVQHGSPDSPHSVAVGHLPYFTVPFLNPRFLHALEEALGLTTRDADIRAAMFRISEVDRLANTARRSLLGDAVARGKFVSMIAQIPPGKVPPPVFIDGDGEVQGGDSETHHRHGGTGHNDDTQTAEDPLLHLFNLGPVLDIAVAVVRDCPTPCADVLRNVATHFASLSARVAACAQALTFGRSRGEVVRSVLLALDGKTPAPAFPLECEESVGARHVSFASLVRSLRNLSRQWPEATAQHHYAKKAAPRAISRSECLHHTETGEATFALEWEGKDANQIWCGNRILQNAKVGTRVEAIVPPFVGGRVIAARKLNKREAAEIAEAHERDGHVAPHGWSGSLLERMGVLQLAPPFSGATPRIDPDGFVFRHLKIYDEQGVLVGGLGRPTLEVEPGTRFRVEWQIVGRGLPHLARRGGEWMKADSPEWQDTVGRMPDIATPAPWSPPKKKKINVRREVCVRRGTVTSLGLVAVKGEIQGSFVDPPAPAGVGVVPKTTEGKLVAELTIGADAPDHTIVHFNVIGPTWVVQVQLEIHVIADEGRWLSGGKLGVVATHSALLPGVDDLQDVKVICFGYDEDDPDDEGKGEYQLWDPVTRKPFMPADAPENWTHNHSPFCSGHCFLPNGRLLVAGGHIAHDGNYNEPAARALHAIQRDGNSYLAIWLEGDLMEDDRWYPTVVTLPSGKAIVLGGSSQYLDNSWNGTNEDYELIAPDTLTISRPFEKVERDPYDWKRPDGDNRDFTQDDNSDSDLRVVGLYVHAQLLPTLGTGAKEGILYLLTEFFARLWDPAKNRLLGLHNNPESPPVSKQEWYEFTKPQRVDVGGYRTWHNQGTSVLLPIDLDADARTPSHVRILVLGGGTFGKKDENESALQNGVCLVYDVAERVIKKEQTLTLASKRFMGDAVLLPTGEVLLVNGAQKGYTNTNSGPVFTPELVRLKGSASSPTAPEISIKSPTEPHASIQRRYHSTALLLPDGAVFVGGSSGGWGGENFKHEFKEEVYEPWYFRCSERPLIMDAPSEIHWDQRVAVRANTAALLKHVVLLRYSSVTHSLNTDQRLLRIAAFEQERGILRFIVPKNRTLAPPGPYLMFVFDDTGLPSKGRTVLLR